MTSDYLKSAFAHLGSLTICFCTRLNDDSCKSKHVAINSNLYVMLRCVDGNYWKIKYLYIESIHNGMTSFKINIIGFPLSAVHRVAGSKISGANSSSLALKVSWMDVYSEIYDGWLRTACN